MKEPAANDRSTPSAEPQVPTPSSAKFTAMNIALVLAGSRRPSDPVAQAANARLKAFVPINGRTMLHRVVTTLIATARFDSIRICLPKDLAVHEECPWLETALQQGELSRVDAAESPTASVLRSLETLPAPARLVVTTADHPLLDVDMIHAFLAGMEAGEGDAFVALTDVRAIRARYPSMRRTALKFKDAPSAGCNLFAFKQAGIPLLRFFQQLENHRKQPLHLARRLGYGTLIQYLLGQMTIGAALDRLAHKTGARLQVIKLEDPHAGIDVDTLDDLATVRAIIGSR